MDIKATITAIWQGSISIDMTPTMTLKVLKLFSGSVCHVKEIMKRKKSQTVLIGNYLKN